MDLGAFSISLAVKDLETSRGFYEQLGFEVSGGGHEQSYYIMRNGQTPIGLFQGMFEKNILTFNPGFSQTGEPVEPFTDVREIQRSLKENGLSLDVEADEDSTGPAHCLLEDPDGNPILIDQFS